MRIHESKYPPLTATVIHATERDQPQDRDRIEWKLVTDLDVEGLEDAIRMLRWYELRWKIEVFHKILKLARLGGYLARSNDPYPGNIVVWSGMSRLTDICLGLELAGDVGN